VTCTETWQVIADLSLPSQTLIAKADAAAERIIGDDEAQALLSRAYRAGHWAVPRGV